MAKDGREEVGVDRCVPRAPWFGTCFGSARTDLCRCGKDDCLPPTSFCNCRIHPHLFLLPGMSSKPQGLCNNSVMLVAKDKFSLVWCVLCWSLATCGVGEGMGVPSTVVASPNSLGRPLLPERPQGWPNAPRLLLS